MSFSRLRAKLGLKPLDVGEVKAEGNGIVVQSKDDTVYIEGVCHLLEQPSSVNNASPTDMNFAFSPFKLVESIILPTYSRFHRKGFRKLHMRLLGENCRPTWNQYSCMLHIPESTSPFSITARTGRSYSLVAC